MKSILTAIIILTTGYLAAFEQTMRLSLWQGTGVANPAGNTYNISFLELSGMGQTGHLDMDYAVQVNEIFGWRDIRRQSVPPGSYRVMLSPRFDVGGFLDRDLGFGPVRIWFLTGLYEGRADHHYSGDFYSAGLTADISILYTEEFRFNIFKKYEHINRLKNNEWKVSFRDSGWLLRLDWELVLKHIAGDLIVTYEGWASCGFANKWAKENYSAPDGTPAGTSSEWQMFNGLFWNAGKWAISTSFKLHRYLFYRDSNTHDALSMYFGLHRKF